MTIALVHGNPEVAAIWDDVRAVLDRDDVVALSPPGFGADVPDGFRSTAPEYADWLVDRLDQLDGPIHLIGHDWGGMHVINALLRRPWLLASVTTDVGGCFHPDYTWHDLAQLWRAPGAGEETVAAMAATPIADRAAGLEALGMSTRAAQACADAGPEMGPHILALYRSADEATIAGWGDEVEAMPDRPPIHVVIATEDGYTGGPALARATAERWGATVHQLDGLGHWWMMQDPAAAAAIISSIAS